MKAYAYFSKKELITTTQLWPTTNCDQQTDRLTVSNDFSFMSCKHRINYIYPIYQWIYEVQESHVSSRRVSEAGKESYEQ